MTENFCSRYLVSVVVVLVFGAAPAPAWSPVSQERIAATAARLAPPDLYRQIVRNRDAYLLGAVTSCAEPESPDHVANPDGSGRLDALIPVAVGNAIQAIVGHRPFNEIVYRLGLVAHYLADANDPLSTARSDPREPRFRADFDAYRNAAELRLQVIFYGFRPSFQGRRDLPQLIRETLDRSRRLYPLVGQEYARIGFATGVDGFDDRSTAFAVAALGFSHAVSDIAEVLRYIWLEAGGIDTRGRLPVRGREMIPIGRPSREREEPSRRR